MALRPPEYRRALKQFGLRVRELRHQRKWTLEQCEERGAISWRYLQKIEAGEINATIQTIINLSNLFGVHPSTLFETV